MTWGHTEVLKTYTVRYFGPEVVNAIELDVRAMQVDDVEFMAGIWFGSLEYVSIRKAK